MTGYPYQRIGALLLSILVLVTAVLNPAGPHPRAEVTPGVTVVLEHVHGDDNETVSVVVAPRATTVIPVTTTTVTSAPAPVRPVRSLISHIDLRLPGVLRV